MSEWQDISTAPRGGTKLLIWCDFARRDKRWAEGGLAVTGWWSDEYEDWIGNLSDGCITTVDCVGTPVAWMPLPTPTKGLSHESTFIGWASNA